MKSNIKKSMLISAAGAMMCGGAHAGVPTKQMNINDEFATVRSAARLTVGTIVKYETMPSLTPDVHIIGYHIDTDGDGRADVVRYRMIATNESHVMQSPFAIVEITETYDEKNHVWNITHENVIGSCKLKNPPVYTPTTKTR